MFVEDDADLRAVLSDILQEEGFRVVPAGDGHQALELLKQGDKPALILLDLMMPGMDGWQLRRAISEDPKLADIPIVVMSAFDDLKSVPAAAHLRKPIRRDLLLSVLRDLLK